MLLVVGDLAMVFNGCGMYVRLDAVLYVIGGYNQLIYIHVNFGWIVKCGRN